jgi:hypothetical protein
MSFAFMTDETRIHFCCHMESDCVESSILCLSLQTSYLLTMRLFAKTAATILAEVSSSLRLFSGLETPCLLSRTW